MELFKLWFNFVEFVTICVLCICASHGTICADASCHSRWKSPHQKTPYITKSQFVLIFSTNMQTGTWKAICLLHGCELLVLHNCAKEPALKTFLGNADVFLLHSGTFCREWRPLKKTNAGDADAPPSCGFLYISHSHVCVHIVPK